MLARTLAIPVIRKDDIVDALKSTQGIDKTLINNTVCYNILYKIIQTNLDLSVDFILDIALGDKKNAKSFFDRLDFNENKAFWFFTICSDEEEWRKRHMARIANPTPNQAFKSYEHVIEHYNNADVKPFEYEHIIDSAEALETCLNNIISIIKA